MKPRSVLIVIATILGTYLLAFNVFAKSGGDLVADVHEIAVMISAIVGIFAIIASVFISIGVGRANQRHNAAEIKKVNVSVECLRETTKKRLYFDNGTSIFVPRADCEKQSEGYQGAVCRKIDDLKAEIGVDRKDRADLREDFNQLERNLAGFMAATAEKLELAFKPDFSRKKS